MINRRSAIKTTLGGLLAWLGLSKSKANEAENKSGLPCHITVTIRDQSRGVDLKYDVFCENAIVADSRSSKGRVAFQCINVGNFTPSETNTPMAIDDFIRDQNAERCPRRDRHKFSAEEASLLAVEESNNLAWLRDNNGKPYLRLQVP